MRENARERLGRMLERGKGEGEEGGEGGRGKGEEAKMTTATMAMTTTPQQQQQQQQQQQPLQQRQRLLMMPQRAISLDGGGERGESLYARHKGQCEDNINGQALFQSCNGPMGSVDFGNPKRNGVVGGGGNDNVNRGNLEKLEGSTNATARISGDLFDIQI